MGYKPFSKQFKECVNNGVAFEEKCFFLPGNLNHMMCKKYGGQCSSKKCLKERTA